MVKITNNLYRREVACKCGCGFETIDYMVANAHQSICDYLKEKLNKKIYSKIHSGCRCEWWNGHEGGKKNSLHQKGMAIDFEIIDVKVRDVENALIAVLDLEIYDYYIRGNVFHVEYDKKENKSG